MRPYIIRRLLLLIPTLWIVSVIVFLLVRFLPGDVLDLIESQFEAMNMQIDREAFMRMLGLDVPVHVQYGRWMEGILLRGTLGKSLFGDFAVEERILGALPVTLQLGVISLVIAQVIALPVGNLLGGAPGHGRRLRGPHHRRHRPGHAQLLAGHHGHDLPRHLVGLVAADGVGAVRQGPGGEHRHVHHSQPDPGHGPVRDHHAHDPHHDAGGAAPGLHQNRLVQGLRERAVVVQHALKNAFIPIVTLIGAQLPILVGGSVIMENIFNLPGLGRLTVTALTSRDYPLVSGVNLFFAAVIMLNNLVIDLIYAFLDPRVRYS